MYDIFVLIYAPTYNYMKTNKLMNYPSMEDSTLNKYQWELTDYINA